MNIQQVVDAMIAADRMKRMETQMTLGEMISALQTLPQDSLVYGLGELASYRGYYADLAFDPVETSRTVADLLEHCQDALGKTFEGWKGGDYLMTKATPLWVSPEGECSGIRVMGIRDRGDGTCEVELSPEREDDSE